jgi:hypothetical protein
MTNRDSKRLDVNDKQGFEPAVGCAPVDNFTAFAYLPTAYILSNWAGAGKCLIVLNIPALGTKDTHTLHFIQRALC